MNYNIEETWLAVDGHGDERCFNEEPYRNFPNMPLEVLWGQRWKTPSIDDNDGSGVKLPKGTIKHLIGRELTWEDEPVKI